MKWYIIIFSVLLFISLHASKNIAIIVHGTWAQEQCWHQPESDFCTALRQADSSLHIVLFSWTGHNTHKARVQAAQRLAELIMSYPKETHLTLIGHSHGGNVINLASQLLPAASHFYIDTFISLATPVNMAQYAPAMNRIKQVIHLFSFQDFVQPVLGMFERAYDSHTRIMNVQTFIEGREIGHAEFHHALIAHKLRELISFFSSEKCPFMIAHFTQETLRLTPGKDLEAALYQDKINHIKLIEGLSYALRNKPN